MAIMDGKMTHPFKEALKHIPGVYRTWLQWNQIRPVIYYRLAGSSVAPPHLVKMRWLSHFQSSYDLQTLVETGTYLGTTVAAMLSRFEQIYTIELDCGLWERARTRFSEYPHVHVVPGNSGDVLPAILAGIPDRCLFWLDGHFSGPGTAQGNEDTPIVQELAAIHNHYRKDHVILIDDARLFIGRNGYPTFDSIRSLLKGINPDYTVKVMDDIIQAFLPKRGRMKRSESNESRKS
jgi:hypothetical protein